MMIPVENLELLFEKFSNHIAIKDGKSFTSFETSKFIDKEENYKYSVYEAAKEKLGQKGWKFEDIGSGTIQKNVSSAIVTGVTHNFQTSNNNLIDWRKRESFRKMPNNKTLEALLFNFYKNKITNQTAFEALMEHGLSYQLIAYLFFIKDKDQFMPISQEKFDEIFQLLGVNNFRTSHSLSWENYITFIALIKQTRDFLKSKVHQATLLDAHSFLWISGNQMQEVLQVEDITPKMISSAAAEKDHNPTAEVEEEGTDLRPLAWTEVLQNNDLTNELDLGIFQALYSFEGRKAAASQIALLLNTTHSTLNLEVGRYAKRIAKIYDINFTQRSKEKYKFWDLFFNGWDEGKKFIWQLKPEITQALMETNLTGEEKYPEEISEEHNSSLFEGLKRTVVINSYERNPKARQLCIQHWKAICAVCNFDFEKTYGEIGRGFIHVHHITPVAQIGKEYQIDPITDLVPVCPNCHAMLHRKEPPLSVNELKSLMMIN